jgi:hypothetical protein
LVAVLACCAGEADRGEDEPAAPDPTDATGEDGPVTGGPSPSAAAEYIHPTGCIRFTPAEAWEQVDETGLGVDFSADPDDPLSDLLPPGQGPAPGEPGVMVSANCAPLDQVGTSGPVPIPGFEVVDERVVDLAGGQGRYVEYEIDEPGTKVHTNIHVSIDVNDARCTLAVTGSRDAVDAIQADIDVALDSYVCEGR